MMILFEVTQFITNERHLCKFGIWSNADINFSIISINMMTLNLKYSVVDVTGDVYVVNMIRPDTEHHNIN